jgi:ADP-ribosylation factor GTPase-activating protein 1
MEVGGNRKARLFFEAKGVPKAPVRARYEHIGALMYITKLETEAAGQVFNEQRWSPPEWYQRMKQQDNSQQQQQQQNRGGGNSSHAGQGSRFQGIGSGGNNGRQSSSGGDSEWFSSLASGWSTVASTTSALASKAALSAQELADEASKRAANVNYQQTASESVTAVSSSLSWGWGAVTSFASQLSSGAKSGDEDGLSALTRAVHVSAPPASSERFGHIEHKAEGGTPVDDDDGLSALRRNLPPGDGRYQGVGNTASSARTLATSSSGAAATPIARSPIPRAAGKTPLSQSTPKAAQQVSTPSSQPKKSEWDWDEE